MSHIDALMRLATEFAEAEAQSKWDGDCERASQSESRKSDEIRDSARAALREACEKLCGAFSLARHELSALRPGLLSPYTEYAERTCEIMDRALAHLTKGTA